MPAKKSLKNDDYFPPHYEECGSFKGKWEQYVKNEYYNKINIWACPFSEEHKDAIDALETQIQMAVGKQYNLSYYENLPNLQNWLGMSSKGVSKLNKYNFTFANLPSELDDKTHEILNNLLNYV